MQPEPTHDRHLVAGELTGQHRHGLGDRRLHLWQTQRGVMMLLAVPDLADPDEVRVDVVQADDVEVRARTPQ